MVKVSEFQDEQLGKKVRYVWWMDFVTGWNLMKQISKIEKMSISKAGVFVIGLDNL